MSTGKWPEERQPELEALRASGMTTQDIADMVGVSIQVASYHLKEVEPLGKMIDVLPSYPAEMLRIPDRPCALTADWHAPYFSLKWLRRLLAVSSALKVRDLAIVGDFTDLSWISHYTRLETRGGGLNQDVRVVLSTLQTLLLFYGDVWWCYGNHEDRLPQRLGGQDMMVASAEAAAKNMPGNLHMSDMKSMLLGDHWRLEHPKKFSADAAKVAAACGAIYHMNVACAHGHHFGFKYDVSGQFVGIDLGGMFDMDKQEYLFKTGATTLPTWNAGFWVYANGKVRPFEDAITDWTEYGVE